MEPNRTAYLAGWDASKRTTTYDLDAAETRFLRRHGHDHLDAFIAGWTDHATDVEKFTSLGAAS